MNIEKEKEIEREVQKNNKLLKVYFVAGEYLE
jgi:hypothetical protein